MPDAISINEDDDAVQPRWDLKAGALRYQPRHTALIKAAGIEPGMRVLEVAAGRGEVAIACAKKGAQVTATDVGPALVSAIRRNADSEGVGDRVRAMVGNMCALRFPDQTFDRVLGAAALHHVGVEDARQAVLEAVRVLVPDGRAYFVEPVENVPALDRLKYLVPTDRRPSILSRRAWLQWKQDRDDRPMSDRELLDAWPQSRVAGRVGMFARLRARPPVWRFDEWLLDKFPATGPFAQQVVIEYRKAV